MDLDTTGSSLALPLLFQPNTFDFEQDLTVEVEGSERPDKVAFLGTAGNRSKLQILSERWAGTDKTGREEVVGPAPSVLVTG